MGVLEVWSLELLFGANWTPNTATQGNFTKTTQALSCVRGFRVESVNIFQSLPCCLAAKGCKHPPVVGCSPPVPSGCGVVG